MSKNEIEELWNDSCEKVRRSRKNIENKSRDIGEMVYERIKENKKFMIIDIAEFQAKKEPCYFDKKNKKRGKLDLILALATYLDKEFSDSNKLQNNYKKQLSNFRKNKKNKKKLFVLSKNSDLFQKLKKQDIYFCVIMMKLNV